MRKKQWLGAALCCALLVATVGCDEPKPAGSGMASASPGAGQSQSASGTYFPGEEWRSSTPEEQGMDSETLYAAIQMAIAGRESASSLFDSLLIVRNGYIVAEAYGPRKQPNSRQLLHSATKSVTSALLGIAIDEGYIKDVNTSLWSGLKHGEVANWDDRKQAITIEHVLTMSSGLAWNEFGAVKGPEDSAYNMYNSGNLADYVMNRPMADKPGAVFNYSSGSSVLLSRLIADSTGTDTASYAKRKLFAPLGITDVNWELFDGIANGASFLYMTSRDMARIGYLYLNNGQWNGEQIVPRAWVEASTRKHIDGGQLRRADLQADGYGYQWWIDSFGGYSARGQYGQYIFVQPKLNLVAVFQSHLSDTTRDFELPLQIMQNGVIAAVKSSKPLPRNSRAQELAGVLMRQRMPQDDSWRQWE
ncbi:serine hydrolase domain-containing protein [Paenibacillus athensensis]|nr:serine hydrolase [Paenibacillus athensensis]